MADLDAGSRLQLTLPVDDSGARHVRGTLDELDGDALRRPVLPSGWHCPGLVQHLALDVERFVRAVPPTGRWAWHEGDPEDQPPWE